MRLKNVPYLMKGGEKIMMPVIAQIPKTELLPIPEENGEILKEAITMIALTVGQIAGGKTEAKKKEILELIKEIEDELED